MTRSPRLQLLVMLGALLLLAPTAPSRAQQAEETRSGEENGAAPSAGVEAEPEQEMPERGVAPTPEPAPQFSGEDARVELVDELPLETEVGRPVTLRFDFDLPPGSEAIAARVVENEFVETASQLREDSEGSFSLDLVIFRPGLYEDAQVELTWLSPAGQQLTTRSAPFATDVRSLIANEDDPELAPPGEFLLIQTPNVVLMALLFGGGGGALLAFLIVMLRRRRRPVEVAPPPPPRPAWEIAFEELDALRRSELLEESRHLEFHMQLSEIVRRWLKNAYQFNALEMTTSEIRAELNRRRGVTGPLVDDVLEILADTDVVKFARFAPGDEESMRLLQRAQGCVEEGQRLQEEHQAVPPPPQSGEADAVASPVASSPQPEAPGRDHALRESQAASEEQNIVQLPRADSTRRDEP